MKAEKKTDCDTESTVTQVLSIVRMVPPAHVHLWC